uniref:NADH-ubiquinone oxidoreductase chain 6 n=1 Tax=Pediacus sp. MJ-2020 TaxID=2762522 RepID=A0A7G7MTR1_9CUCU|nr:NADH dehydrogenase subunit 6 [Pediacus sp. MJ-2020]
MSHYLMVMLMMTSFTFLFMSHPITLGSMLLIQTILITILSGMMNFNFWYSYIIFLVMIGGMLILFMYMTSIASNEKFYFSMKLFMLNTMMMWIMMFINKDYLKTNYLLLNEMFLNKKINFNMSLFMNKFLFYPYMMLYLMVIIYLFITLIATVKIINIKYGPLRQKM